MSNKKLTKRVMTLIENKNKDFKEKFYLLSYLANTDIKSDERLMSEADCYINTLVNTDGVKPDIKHVHNLLKESIKIKEGAKYKKEFECVKDLCRLINIEKLSSEESFIFEELNSISNLTDFKLNNKLKNIFLKSVNNNTPLLISEAIKTVDADDLLDNFYGDKKVSKPNTGRYADLDLDVLDDNEAYSDEAVQDDDEAVQDDDDFDKKVNARELNRRQKEVLLRYDWLLKRKNIPFIASKLNIYLPKQIKKKGVSIPPPENLENIPAIDKLAIVAKYKLIVEQSATVKALRKFEIINQIYYYLNIQKRFLDSDMAQIMSVGEKDLTKNRKSRFSSSPSRLTDDEKREVKAELDKLISKINLDNASTLDSDTVSESELISILKKSVGVQKDAAVSFLSYLNNAYPLSGNKQNSQEVMSDEEYEEYLRGNRELDAKEALEDDEEFRNDLVDAESGEPLYASVETAAKIASSYKKENDFEEVEVEAADAIQLMSQKSQSLMKIQELETKAKARKKLVRSSNEEKQKFIAELSASMTRSQVEAEKQKPGWQTRMYLSELDRAEFDDAIEKYSVLVGTKLIVIPDRSKKEVHDEILHAIDKPQGANKLNPTTGKIESSTWNEFFDKYLDYDPENPTSNADIARLSQGQWRDTGGVRQSVGKSFAKSLFYTSNIKVKSEIYAELGKKYIDIARKLGLVEFDISSVGEDTSSIETKGDIVSFKRLEELITREDVFEEYFTSGLSNEEDEETLDYLTTKISSFRIFCNEYLDYFYSNFIWNKCEVKIALAIKKYFSTKYPGSNIGKSLDDNTKTWRGSKVDQEHGRMLFDTIINWTMGRSGIKDSGNVISNPKMELDQRKNAFINGQGKFKSLAEKVSSFNSMSYANKIQNFDPEHLMYDCLNDTSKVSAPYPIIGAAFKNCSELNADDRSLFLNYISKQKSSSLETTFIESLMKQEYYDAALNNPNSPLGNPAEIQGIETGSGSESPADSGMPLSTKGAPYFRKHWREAIKSSLKDLAARADKEAKEREVKISQSRNYDFLEDEELMLTDYQVIYDGKLAEISTIDIENQKAKVIIDVLDSKGNVIDVKTVTADFSELRHADLMRK
jgi:hypothetical protein